VCRHSSRPRGFIAPPRAEIVAMALLLFLLH
jgi:hypothetical protein